MANIQLPMVTPRIYYDRDGAPKLALFEWVLLPLNAQIGDAIYTPIFNIEAIPTGEGRYFPVPDFAYFLHDKTVTAGDTVAVYNAENCIYYGRFSGNGAGSGTPQALWTNTASSEMFMYFPVMFDSFQGRSTLAVAPSSSADRMKIGVQWGNSMF